ncbi:PAA1 [Symbiodinium sp. KB8]|nr:PAA1 [Symbiodinium sp. KB8]
MARESGYDRHLTVFSPQGRLYQLEYAFKRVKTSTLTTVGMRGEDCVVVATEKKVQVSPRPGFRLERRAGAQGTTRHSRAPPSRSVAIEARRIASEFQFDNGIAIPVDFLARRVADKAQVFTQHAGRRIFSVVVMLMAVDDELGPQLWRIDPAGLCMGYKAAAAGVKEQEAVNNLEKKIKSDTAPRTREEVTRATVDTLQAVLGEDFKARDIEVAVVTAKDAIVLDDAEVDAHLTAIAEAD